MNIESVGVIGGGAWGTALAQSCRVAGRGVRLWAFEQETVDSINGTHKNIAYLPDAPLDPDLLATTNMKEVGDCDIVLMVAPAQHVRQVSEGFAPHIAEGKSVVICAKGIEQSSQKLMSEVLAETLPNRQIAVLSGPTFAIEIARGLPAALTLATKDETQGMAIAHAISSASFRTYWSEDVVGAQIGGAIKNVLAIAAGIARGKQLGANAHAALIARGFQELLLFGTALGGKSETLSGLSGLGDLILTCSSTNSRNMSLGYALGEGKTIKEVLDQRNSVTEGVYTASAIADIAEAKGIDLPICTSVHAIISGKMAVDDAINALLTRPLRREN